MRGREFVLDRLENLPSNLQHSYWLFFSRSKSPPPPRLLLREENSLELLPQNAEEDSLQSVGDDLRVEASEHETVDPVLGEDVLDGYGVGDCDLGGLLVDLDDADGVGAGVGDCGAAEPDPGAPSKLLELVVLDLGVLDVEEVVGREPGVVTDERCGGGGEGAVVEDGGAGSLDLWKEEKRKGGKRERGREEEEEEGRRNRKEKLGVSGRNEKTRLFSLKKRKANSQDVFLPILSLPFSPPPSPPPSPPLLTFAITGAILPCTCIVVLRVSTGIKKILNKAADAEAPTVLTVLGRLRVSSYESISVMTPVFAAVSPNLLIGPCTSAGKTPL